MPAPIDLSGHRFGRLTAISAVIGGRRRKWRCTCECGREAIVATGLLRRGHSRSCGCLKIEIATKRIVAKNYKHGHKSGGYSREYVSWQAMLQRCTNRNHHAWKDYGGRGITVCAEWLTDFSRFLADMGPRPAHKTLDRIDNDGNYKPSNCRWATQSEQIRNTRPRARDCNGRYA